MSNLVVLAMLSQTFCNPPTVYVYRLGDIHEQWRISASVRYEDGTHRFVPVINGYAPRIRFEDSESERRIIFDYRDKIDYWKCRDRRYEKVLPGPAKNDKPIVEKLLTERPSMIPESPRILTTPTYDQE